MSRSSDDQSGDRPPLLVGQAAYVRFKELFESADMVVPELPPQIITDFFCDEAYETYCTSHFITLLEAERQLTTNTEPGFWSPIAAYGLEFGVPNESDRHPSLREYWEGCGSAPWAFDYFERNNGYSVMVGLIVRTPGLFVSQQTFAGEHFEQSIQSFNSHISPVLGDDSPEGAAMVIYSEYRNDAYILSSVEESWDEYASEMLVLAPVPDGWGIVGTWSKFDESRYTPRSLDYIVSEDYSAQITACAKYLKNCMSSSVKAEPNSM